MPGLTPNATARIWTVDPYIPRAKPRARISTCLDVDFRTTSLGENDKEAQERWAACELHNGRDPNR